MTGKMDFTVYYRGNNPYNLLMMIDKVKEYPCTVSIEHADEEFIFLLVKDFDKEYIKTLADDLVFQANMNYGHIRIRNHPDRDILATNIDSPIDKV